MKTALQWAIGGLAGLSCVAILAAQMQSKQGSVRRVATFMVISIDTSDSGSQQDKLLYGQQAMALIRTLDRSRDRLLVIRFDGRAIEIGSEVPVDMDAYTFLLRDAILKPSTSKGTRQSDLFDHLSAEIEKHDIDGFALRLHIMTDGGDDDRSAEAESRYTSAVRRMAALPQLERLTFWGVRDGLREDIRARFQVLDAIGKVRILRPGERVDD